MIKLITIALLFVPCCCMAQDSSKVFFDRNGNMITKIYYTMEGTPKFGIGDKVRIKEYGALMFGYDNDTNTWYSQDTLPDIVGKEGIVDEVSIPQDNYLIYSVDGIPEKHAWYNEKQLEMINRNPNR